ncbi:MAG: hypothetical protein II198_03275, partial [Bacteroidaceae bacterium]|nr:hypothetical protein [Bacteroidaceae bacterium]
MTETKLDVLFDEGLSNTIPNYVLEDVLADAFKKVSAPVYTQEELDYAQSFKNTFPIENITVPQHAKNKAELLNMIKTQPLHQGVAENAHSEACGMG